MEIVSKTEGSKVTMEITGWLDTQTAPQLEKELSALDPGTTSLVFDFANLEYISSAGLRLVIAAYKKMAGKEGFRIVNVSDEVYDVFSLTGFDQKINIENSCMAKRIACHRQHSARCFLDKKFTENSRIAARNHALHDCCVLL